MKKSRKHYLGICVFCLFAVLVCCGILKIYLEKHVVADDGRTRAIKAAKASYLKDMQTAIDWRCDAECRVDLENTCGKNFLVPVYKSDTPLELEDLEKLVQIEKEILGEKPIWINDYYLLAPSGGCLKVNGEGVLIAKKRREDGEYRKCLFFEEERAPEKQEKPDIASKEKEETSGETETSENWPSVHETPEPQAPPKKSFYHAAPKDTKPESEDPLDVDDYWSVEDFYEDNVDEFEDLDDAEDYYDDHGGF